MADIEDWDTTDASNTDLWPEGMLGGQINDAGRAMQGVLARWFRDISGGLTSSGSSNAFAVTPNRSIGTLVSGIGVAFSANHSITGAATLNLNGIGAKSIKRFNGAELAQGDIVSGQIVVVSFSTALDCWLLVSAPAALTGNSFVDLDENASPGNPAANDARLYAQDDGSGNTNLLWRDSAGAASALRNASQANMEALVAERTVTPAVQHFHPGHPKAGGNFDGSGTPAFRSGDYGMGAITDNGTGSYTLALDTAFANTNYWLNGWSRASTGIFSAVAGSSGGTKTSSSIQVSTTRGNDPQSTPDDSTEVGLTFWGDYA